MILAYQLGMTQSNRSGFETREVGRDVGLRLRSQSNRSGFETHIGEVGGADVERLNPTVVVLKHDCVRAHPCVDAVSIQP